MAAGPTANLDGFLEYVARNNAATATTIFAQYAGRNTDAVWTVDDFAAAVNKFRFPERQTVNGNDQPFECNGELYRWVWTYTLPQHPLCRAYLDEYRKHKAANLSDLMPVQIWAVSEFTDIWSPGEAVQAVRHLERYGCPFHARIVCAPVGHSPPILGIPRVGEARDSVRRERPNRSYHTANSSSSTNRNSAA